MLLKQLLKELNRLVEEDSRNLEVPVYTVTQDDGLLHRIAPVGLSLNVVEDYSYTQKANHGKIFIICSGKPVMYSRPEWWGDEAARV